ncbi:MAG: AraC family transcriptional regulator [Eubacteriales bacterium]
MKLHYITADDLLDPYTHFQYDMNGLNAVKYPYPHIHDFYEVTFILEGYMNIEVNDRSLMLGKDSIIFLRPKDIHSRAIPSSCTFININFSCDVLENMLAYVDIDTLTQAMQEDYPPYVTLDESRTEHLVKKVHELANIAPGEKKLLKAYLRGLLIDIVILYFGSTIASTNAPRQKYPVWFNEILVGLRDDANLIAGLNYIYSISDKTPEHICRSFKRFLGTTPSEYVNSLRLQRAVHLITDTSLNINEVAYRVGFSNMSFFFRLFKTTYGTTPNQFRRQFSIHRLHFDPDSAGVLPGETEQQK